MASKRVLIVDDEESILIVLKNSLTKLGPDYQVTTVNSGLVALDQIVAQPFDLVVTDYSMAQMDGLELLAAIRYAQPDIRVIMMTAYETDALEQEARRLQIYRYLTKPLDINVFRRVVLEALGDETVSRQEPFAISDDRRHQINQILQQLAQDVSARCLFLADVRGQIVAHLGNTDHIPMTETASWLGGSITTLSETGRALDGDQQAISLVYRESKRAYLYALNIGPKLILVMVIDRAQVSSRMSMVWFYAQQVALTLVQMLDGVEPINLQQLFDPRLDHTVEITPDNVITDHNPL